MKIKLTEKKVFNISLLIEGTRENPKGRFFIGNEKGGIYIPVVVENAVANIVLENLPLEATQYDAFLEVYVDNQVFTPWKDSLLIEKEIKVNAVIEEQKEIKKVETKIIEDVTPEKIQKELYNNTNASNPLRQINEDVVQEPPVKQIKEEIKIIEQKVEVKRKSISEQFIMD